MSTKTVPVGTRRLRNLKSFLILKLFYVYSYYSNVYNEDIKFYNQKKTMKLFFILEKRAARVLQKEMGFFLNLFTIKKENNNSADMTTGHNFLLTCLIFQL